MPIVLVLPSSKLLGTNKIEQVKQAIRIVQITRKFAKTQLLVIM